MCKGEHERMRVQRLHTNKIVNTENAFTLVFAHEHEGWARVRASDGDRYCGYGFVMGHEYPYPCCSLIVTNLQKTFPKS